MLKAKRKLIFIPAVFFAIASAFADEPVFNEEFTSQNKKAPSSKGAQV